MTTDYLKRTREMTQDEVSLLIMLERGSNCADDLFKSIVDEGGWVLRAIEKRFVAHGLSVDKRVMIFVLAIGDGVVGECARYVDDIANWAEKAKQSAIDWHRFTHDVYPMGIPVF